MGAETSVVVALLFVGFLVVVIFAYPLVSYNQDLVKKAQHDQDTMKKNKMQTDIIITNISYSNNTGDVYLNITLQNTGKTTLNASLLEIFVKGSYYPSYNWTPANNTWAPINQINISLANMNYTNTTGGRIKVVSENGISSYAFAP